MAVLENPCACPCVAVVNCICVNYDGRTIERLCGCVLCTVDHIGRHSCVRVRRKRALRRAYGGGAGNV